MKKNRSLLMILIGLMIVLVAFPTNAYATSYFLEDLKFYCDLPDTLYTITNKTNPDDEVFEKLNTTYEEEHKAMEAENIYLNAYSEDFKYKIVVSMTETEDSRKYFNFATLSENQMNSIVESFKSHDDFLSCGIYSTKDAKFINYIMEYTGDNNRPVHIAQYTTIINGQQINFQLFSYSEELLDSELTVLNALINTIRFVEILPTPKTFNPTNLLWCFAGLMTIVLIVLLIILFVNKKKNDGKVEKAKEKEKIKKNKNNKNKREAIVKDTFDNLENEVEKILVQNENIDSQTSTDDNNVQNIETISVDESELVENDGESEEDSTAENIEEANDEEKTLKEDEALKVDATDDKSESVNGSGELSEDTKESTAQTGVELLDKETEKNNCASETEKEDLDLDKAEVKDESNDETAENSENNDDISSIFDNINTILNNDQLNSEENEEIENTILDKENEILVNAINDNDTDKNFDNNPENEKSNDNNIEDEDLIENESLVRTEVSLETALGMSDDEGENNDIQSDSGASEQKKPLDVNIKTANGLNKKPFYKKAADFVVGLGYLALYGVYKLTSLRNSSENYGGSSSVQSKNKTDKK